MSKKTPRKEGDLCFIELGPQKDVRLAVIKYVGRIQGKEGEWLGVEVIKGLGPYHGTGKNDGVFNDVEYFECEAGQGVFTRRVRNADNPKESGVITRAERIQKKVYRALEHKNAIAEVHSKKRILKQGRKQTKMSHRTLARQRTLAVRQQKAKQAAVKEQIRAQRRGLGGRKASRLTPTRRGTLRDNAATTPHDRNYARQATAKVFRSAASKLIAASRFGNALKRKATPVSPDQKSSKARKMQFLVGDPVKCMNKNGQWERARIIRARPTNTYDIEWEKSQKVEKFKTPRVLRKVNAQAMANHDLGNMDNIELVQWLRTVEDGLLEPYERNFKDGTDGPDLLSFSKDDLKKRVPEPAPRLWLLRCILHERKGSGFTEPDTSGAEEHYSADEEEKRDRIDSPITSQVDEAHVTGNDDRAYRTLPGFRQQQPVLDHGAQSRFEKEICVVDPDSSMRKRILKALGSNWEITILDSREKATFYLPGYTLEIDDDPLTWRLNCPVTSKRRRPDGKWAVTFEIGDHPMLRGREHTQIFDDVWTTKDAGSSLPSTPSLGLKRGASSPPKRPGRLAPIRSSKDTELSSRQPPPARKKIDSDLVAYRTERPPTGLLTPKRGEFPVAYGERYRVTNPLGLLVYSEKDFGCVIDGKTLPAGDYFWVDGRDGQWVHMCAPIRSWTVLESHGEVLATLDDDVRNADPGTIAKVYVTGLTDIDTLLLSKQARKALLMSMNITPRVRPKTARGRDDKIIVSFEEKITPAHVQQLQAHLRAGFEEEVVVQAWTEQRRVQNGSDVIFEVAGRDFVVNKNEIRSKTGKLGRIIEKESGAGANTRIKLNGRSPSRFALILDYYRRGIIRPTPAVSVESLVKELEWYDIPLSVIDKTSVLQQIPRLISIFAVDDRQLDELLEKVVRDRRHTRDAKHFEEQYAQKCTEAAGQTLELSLALKPSGDDLIEVIRADGLDGELYKEFDISLRLRNMKSRSLKTISFHMIAGEGYTMRILDKQIKRKDFADALRALLDIPHKYKDNVIEGFLELISETMEYFCDDDEF